MNSERKPSTPLALLADDDALQRTLMERALVAAGYRVVAVDNGRSAVAEVLAHAPDIIFLDVQMPELTGIEACREIHGKLGDRTPPIVVVTSCDRDEDITDGFAAGACDYLIKPVNWTVFKHRVNGWLAAHQLGHETSAAAPRTLVVTRDGSVLSDSAHPDATASANLLADLLQPLLAEQLQLCVRKVLKSRIPANCTFAEWDAVVQAEGRERARIVLKCGEQRASTEADMFKLAYLDPRTELPNRHLFEKTAQQTLTQARLRGMSVTLVCIAPEVLRTSGTPRADAALQRSLAKVLAELGAIDALVAHKVTAEEPVRLACIDGSYLVLLLQDPPESEARARLVAQIIEIVKRAAPEWLQRQHSEAIGRAGFPRDADSAESLLQAAILAALDPSQNDSVRTRRLNLDQDVPDHMRDDLAAELTAALDRGEICLHYQPRLCVKTRRVLGAEALLRWQHPLRGPLVARELLRIAELTGLTARVTTWALSAAIAQAAAWTAQRPTRIPVSVNISATQLARADFAASLIAMLAESGLDPALLEIEVSEIYLNVNDAISAQLLELRTAGVGLIVDDFGHGRIALSALRRLRIDGFKVNHATLRESHSPGDSGIYDLAASIARVRHAVLIGKGIESAAELALAASKGCDQAQGFHLCQPLPAVEFERFVHSTASTAAAG